MFLSFLGGRFLGIILGSVLIAAVVGGFWIYQKSVVSSLQKKIEELQQENNNLRIELNSKEVTIANLRKLLEQKEKNLENIIRESERLRMLVEESNKRLQETSRRLQSIENRERLKRLLQSRKRELVLRIINRNIECWIENFEKRNGRCVNGRWIENRNENQHTGVNENGNTR